MTFRIHMVYKITDNIEELTNIKINIIEYKNLKSILER